MPPRHAVQGAQARIRAVQPAEVEECGQGAASLISLRLGACAEHLKGRDSDTGTHRSSSGVPANSIAPQAHTGQAGSRVPADSITTQTLTGQGAEHPPTETGSLSTASRLLRKAPLGPLNPISTGPSRTTPEPRRHVTLPLHSRRRNKFQQTLLSSSGSATCIPLTSVARHMSTSPTQTAKEMSDSKKWDAFIVGGQSPTMSSLRQCRWACVRGAHDPFI